MLKIFVAEDDPVILMGFKVMVKRMGHQVIADACDGQTAVEEIVRKLPDLIIMDVNMPVMDGISALEAVRERTGKIIPSIIVTGYRDTEMIERATKAGAFAYLKKPIDEYEFQGAISIAVGRGTEAQQLQEELKKSEKALQDRKVIERAKGILMDQFGLKEADAMKALQKKSRDNNKTLPEVAKQIIAASSLLK